MTRKRIVAYAVFYTVGVLAFAAIPYCPALSAWWVPVPVGAVMAWPFLMLRKCGRFGFKFHFETPDKPYEYKPEKQDRRDPVKQHSNRRQPIPTLDLLRQGETEAHRDKIKARAQIGTDIDLSDIPLPPGNWKTNYPPKQDLAAKPPSKQDRPQKGKPSRPPATRSESTPKNSVKDEVDDFWDSMPSRRRQPDEYSLPLFPDEEARPKAAVQRDKSVFL